ncbi:MAG: serine/threonine-protein kinase [Cyanobacteriota bacterium]
MKCEAVAVLPQKRYRIDTPITQGIFADTYQGIDSVSQQPVVISTLAQTLVGHPDYDQFKDIFLNLAQRLTKCRHSHLVPILDSGEKDGQPYLVSPLIPGKTLAQYVESTQLPSLEQALIWIEQIAVGLMVLHAAGLKHQDLNPNNIILCEGSNEVVLINCCLTDEFSPQIRQTRANLSASSYLAPEYYDSQALISNAADIYSLTGIFYYLITGDAPPPAPLREFLAFSEWQRLPKNLSPGIRRMIVQGLARSPQKRPQTLDQWLSLSLPTESQMSGRKSRENLRLTNAAPFPLTALFLTSAIAGSAGVGFGLAFRLQRPTEAGSTILHSDQSFPPRNNWPISGTDLFLQEDSDR